MDVLISKIKKWFELDNLVLCSYSGICVYTIIGLFLGFSSWWNLLLNISIIIITIIFKRKNKQNVEKIQCLENKYNKLEYNYNQIKKEDL